jgi:predicted metal-binding membrane protein
MDSIRPSRISPDVRSPGEPAAGRGSGLLTLGGIVIVLAISWGYLAYMAWGMENMSAAADWWFMPRMSDWGGADLALVFVMWAIMMAAMMLPSAVPLLLLIARTNSQRYSHARASIATTSVGLGYAAAWGAFSVLATLAQWRLLEARLVSPMMVSSSPYLSAVLLAAAGAYQFTAWKYACLSECRSPLSALMTQRRGGIGGAFLLGLRQGTYCIGCCWLLMVLLFVLGVMNLLWIAALTLLVLLEKLLHRPRWFVQLTGATLLVWAAVVAGQAMFLRDQFNG